jgi:hypothetical protein
MFLKSHFVKHPVQKDFMSLSIYFLSVKTLGAPTLEAV